MPAASLVTTEYGPFVSSMIPSSHEALGTGLLELQHDAQTRPQRQVWAERRRTMEAQEVPFGPDGVRSVWRSRMFSMVLGALSRERAPAGRIPYSGWMALLSYRRHRFPPTLIQHAIWLYLRFYPQLPRC